MSHTEITTEGRLLGSELNVRLPRYYKPSLKLQDRAGQVSAPQVWEGTSLTGTEGPSCLQLPCPFSVVNNLLTGSSSSLTSDTVCW